jgi:hypothetical protein
MNAWTKAVEGALDWKECRTSSAALNPSGELRVASTSDGSPPLSQHPVLRRVVPERGTHILLSQGRLGQRATIRNVARSLDIRPAQCCNVEAPCYARFAIFPEWELLPIGDHSTSVARSKTAFGMDDDSCIAPYRSSSWDRARALTEAPRSQRGLRSAPGRGKDV